MSVASVDLHSVATVDLHCRPGEVMADIAYLEVEVEVHAICISDDAMRLSLWRQVASVRGTRRASGRHQTWTCRSGVRARLLRQGPASHRRT